MSDFALPHKRRDAAKTSARGQKTSTGPYKFDFGATPHIAFAQVHDSSRGKGAIGGGATDNFRVATALSKTPRDQGGAAERLTIRARRTGVADYFHDGWRMGRGFTSARVS